MGIDLRTLAVWVGGAIAVGCVIWLAVIVLRGAKNSAASSIGVTPGNNRAARRKNQR